MFPTDLIRALQITLQILRKLKWVFVAALYYSAYSASLELHDFRLMLALLPLILLSCHAYVADRGREEKGFDDFKGDRLFFRYKELIYYATISVPVKEEWSFAATQVSSSTLRAALAQSVMARLPSDSVQVLASKTVKDLESNQQKDFTRVLIRSTQGSSVIFFVHYAAFGHTITAHHFTYLRGAYSTWDVVKFVIASPLTIWFWGVPWLLNRYSIIAPMSRFRQNSFDGIDLMTMYKVVHRVILEETLKLLRTAGLLTDEIERAIHFHISNVQNSQNISVSNSSSVSLGNVSQAVPAKPAAAQPVPA